MVHLPTIISREFLEIIRKNAARMSRLTEDLLTLARVESGEQRFIIQRVSAEALLQDALESFREIAGPYDVELVVENAVPEAHVDADREAIHQIFSNLIENALKYAATGRKIVLGARAVEGGVEFSVPTSVRESPRSTCPACSSVSTGSIKPARASLAAPD